MNKFGFLALLSICLALPLSAQSTAPSLSVDEKLAYRDVQHKLDGILAQRKNLQINLQQINVQATQESARLDKLEAAAQGELAILEEKRKAKADAKLWQWDVETLTYSAVPQPSPAAPENASSKPAETPKASPGAAAPPVQQAKK